MIIIDKKNYQFFPSLQSSKWSAIEKKDLVWHVTGINKFIDDTKNASLGMVIMLKSRL